MIHPTVTLTSPDGEAVEVDEMLAPLISELWRHGFNTVACCQDEGGSLAEIEEHLPHLRARHLYPAGYSYIDFRDDADAAAFLNAVADGGPRNAFYVRMVHWAAPGAWRTGASFTDWSMDDEGNLSEPSAFELGVPRVAFPTTDIPEIMRRLHRHRDGAPPILGPVDWSTIEIPDVG